MQCLEVSGAVRLIYKSLGVQGLTTVLPRFPGVEAIGITYSECVFVASGIQHAMRVFLIILPSSASPAVICFPTLSHKWYDCLKTSLNTQWLTTAPCTT